VITAIKDKIREIKTLLTNFVVIKAINALKKNEARNKK
jgi:hypothetical protein